MPSPRSAGHQSNVFRLGLAFATEPHRRIKQRVRPMQTFQVFRNAQVTIAGIELAHQFRKEKRKCLAKKQGRGLFENPWMKLLAA